MSKHRKRNKKNETISLWDLIKLCIALVLLPLLLLIWILSKVIPPLQRLIVSKKRAKESERQQIQREKLKTELQQKNAQLKELSNLELEHQKLLANQAARQHKMELLKNFHTNIFPMTTDNAEIAHVWNTYALDAHNLPDQIIAQQQALYCTIPIMINSSKKQHYFSLPLLRKH